jgi:hypothetical protein
MTDKPATEHTEDHMGAVEGDTPSDKQQGNDHAAAIDDQGRAVDPLATCEDVLGANIDGSEGG